ncbi:50S ribosomal protein L11 methyltransferase [Pseudorhodoplanes sinuspersici]|uniref:Ribosomal protein L11 methyltransferase n=1 Tax=Pseudorhodoplanes sinuspersici TaxID=1235591 RepID=A0A1W6ZKI9_9HYPH|nr:50S ribosomal protein L11 methyltransferase [Pseudorhodoplanes sinuspersici]ARP97933.1 50S ribosomal protein L11 methyltransferase [Pseudorhodoplanes sinuspersici]
MTSSPESRDETSLARIVTDKATASRIADLLGETLDPELCAVSIFETPDGWATEAIFHDDETRELIADIVARELGPAAQGQIEITTIEKRDWVAASLEGLVPVHAGRFVIHGAHDRARVRLNQIGIEIEAALAFGTGHHGTTRGCLLAFDAIRKRARNAHAWRILDIGTGTGVLAIAAARALTIPVLASDIDPMAVAVARENARLNHVPSLVSVFTAAGAHAHRFRLGCRYDLIFANILEAPLRRMSATLSNLVAPGGFLILSGLLPAHAVGVIAAYRRQGLVLESRLTLDGWVTLTMRRGG